MADFIKTIPDQRVQEVIDAYCWKFNYKEYIDVGVPNPETKQQFAIRMDKQMTLNIWKQYQEYIDKQASITRISQDESGLVN